jgi:ribonuclease P protein component
MHKEERLKKNSQFAEVYSNGRSWANGLLALRTLPNGLDINRYGFSVSKRLGKPTRKGWDLVVVARQPASAASYKQLEEALADLLKKGRLIEG